MWNTLLVCLLYISPNEWSWCVPDGVHYVKRDKKKKKSVHFDLKIYYLTSDILLLFIVSQESHSKLILNRSKEKSLRSGFWCVMWRHTRSWHLNQSASKVQCIQWRWMQSDAATQCLNKEIHFLFSPFFVLFFLVFFIIHWAPSISSCLYSKLIICSILKIDCLAETTALWC